jgi:hypothetical protein
MSDRHHTHKDKWWRFQPNQKLVLQGLKKSIPMDVGHAQFLVTRSLQKTLVGLAFALAVAGVAAV